MTALRSALALGLLCLAGCVRDPDGSAGPWSVRASEEPAPMSAADRPRPGAQLTILERNLIAHEERLNTLFVEQLALREQRLERARIEAAVMRAACTGNRCAGTVLGGDIPLQVATFTAGERQRAGQTQGIGL